MTTSTHSKGLQWKRQNRKGVKKKLKEWEEKLFSLEETYHSHLSRYPPSSPLLLRLHSEVKALTRILTKPALSLGSSLEWISLLGECVEVTVNEKDSLSGSFSPVAKYYLYRFCPFLYLTQTSLDDPNATPNLLGTWEGWDPTDPEVMIYSQGAPCGERDREVRVRVECFPSSQILSVREDGQCRYFLLWGTPAACSSKDSEALKRLKGLTEQPLHDEL